MPAIIYRDNAFEPNDFVKLDDDLEILYAQTKSAVFALCEEVGLAVGTDEYPYWVDSWKDHYHGITNLIRELKDSGDFHYAGMFRKLANTLLNARTVGKIDNKYLRAQARLAGRYA